MTDGERGQQGPGQGQGNLRVDAGFAPAEDGKGGDESADQAPDSEGRGPILLKVEYKRLNTFFYDYTKNISKGGTFIKTDRPLPVGTIFLFHLTVPVDVEPIELRGEVRWVVRAGESPPAELPTAHEAGMGIRFVFEDAAERTRLERTVERMMVNSLGQLAYSKLLGREPLPGRDGKHQQSKPASSGRGDATASSQQKTGDEPDDTLATSDDAAARDPR